MQNFLKSIDQFGVAFQPSIRYSATQYKTCWGGLMSIILYGLSFAYLIYIFVQWQTGQLLPKITQTSDIQDNFVFSKNEEFLEIGLRKYGYTKIDPFDPNRLILQPLLHLIKNDLWDNTTITPQYEIAKQDNGFHNVIISNLSLSLSEINNDQQPEYEIRIIFALCKAQYLKPGQQCADQSIIDNFFSQLTNTIVIKQFASEFNTKTRQLETIGRESIIPLQSNKTYSTQIFVQLATTQVDTGFLFEQLTQYNYVKEFRINGVALDLDYYNKIQSNVYLAFTYDLDNIQIQQFISYSKISEILADAGSIASTLLLFSYIVVTINSNKLQFETIKNIIGMYYPDFKKVKIHKNFIGNIFKVEQNGKQLDLQCFKQYYNRLSQISEIKLSISNQIYEISRLQFLFHSQQANELLSQIHEIGIPFNCPLLESIDSTSKLEVYNLDQDQKLKQIQIQPNEGIQTESKFITFPQNDNLIELKDCDFDLLTMPIHEKNEQ